MVHRSNNISLESRAARVLFGTRSRLTLEAAEIDRPVGSGAPTGLATADLTSSRTTSQEHRQQRKPVPQGRRDILYTRLRVRGTL